MALKVLVLEDNPSRIETFKKYLKGRAYDVYYYDEAREAIGAIETFGPFDVYFLDHDLGGMIYVDSNEENTGYQVAKHLSKNKIYENAQIFIHSLNQVGAENMFSLLPGSIVLPFPNLVELVLNNISSR